MRIASLIILIMTIHSIIIVIIITSVIMIMMAGESERAATGCERNISDNKHEPQVLIVSDGIRCVEHLSMIRHRLNGYLA